MRQGSDGARERFGPVLALVLSFKTGVYAQGGVFMHDRPGRQGDVAHVVFRAIAAMIDDSAATAAEAACRAEPYFERSTSSPTTRGD